ncbi:ABC transporter ATP-binding protein [Thermococcus sp. SY098]|uniref:Nickel import system ATP-binding protein NikD n=1 Tax=Thermococcus barophilus (strain DSM 11836 / MP) TaxID=391623 RepID=F0LIF9_THEBM|nr:MULTISPECIES: ABC transporter ATP-binding protein [Thermococcus]ADT84489.1 dipeptide transport ATP-binding DppD-like protein [Thermococcus barophilus MP]WRS53596.1 ABC transporter ATP-binding protein [Thermococcus sp. SY098]
MPEPILQVRNLTVHFYTYAGIVKAIERVSFDVYRGETFALVGETGCGKSVTSRALTQLIESPGRIVEGEVLYHKEDGTVVDLLKLNEEQIREIRGNEIAYIFQDPHASLDPLYTVGYQIAEAMEVHGKVESIKEGIKKAVDILRSVLIPDPENRVKNYPHELSGGMKQRVVIGIGIANNPKILIADEPTTALDVTVQAQILDLINQLKEKYKATVILITHNLGVVAETADRVAVMYAGKIVEIGSVEQIFKNPLHPYTKGLLKAVPNPMTKIERLEAIPGTVPNLITPPSGCRFHPRCPFATEVCKRKVPELKEMEDGHFVACHLY